MAPEEGSAQESQDWIKLMGSSKKIEVRIFKKKNRKIWSVKKTGVAVTAFNYIFYLLVLLILCNIVYPKRE